MRTAAKVDANQGEIVQALRDMGCSVELLHRVGKGCPDILVGLRGHNWLMEIKDGSKPYSRRKLTPDEKEWHEKWRGQKAVVKSVDEAVALVNGYDCPCQYPPF